MVPVPENSVLLGAVSGGLMAVIGAIVDAGCDPGRTPSTGVKFAELGGDTAYVRCLAEMLRAVVDDADDPGAGGHRRIPVSVDDAPQVVGGDAGAALQRQLGHGGGGAG